MKISVVVPIYNAEQTLERCVLSIISQTYRELEIIIIDDGSSDSSWNICLHLEQIDSRVIHIRKKNEGVSATRNLGIEKATGDWITFVDSDDYLCPDMIAEMVKEIKHDLSIICCSSQYNDGKDFHMFSNDRAVENSKDGVGHILLCGGPTSKLFNANILKSRHILFNEKLSKHEDTVFFWEYMQHIKSIVTISYVGYVYCIQTIKQSLHNKIVHPHLLLKTHDILYSEYNILRNIFMIAPDDNKRIESWLFSFFPQIFMDSYRLHLCRKEKYMFWSLLRSGPWEKFPDRVPKILLHSVQKDWFGIADLWCTLYFFAKYLIRFIKSII